MPTPTPSYPLVLTADLHLTDKPRDEYRWDVFGDLEYIASNSRGRATLVVLGDVTDRKNNHPARLVNRVVESFKRLADAFDHVYIIKGNHDYENKDEAFFSFLSHIPGVTFVSEPLHVGRVAMLPHMRDDAEIADVIARLHPLETDLALLHVTVGGAHASNGQEMGGLYSGAFPSGIDYFSGDIHVPQKVGDFEYVGSPYHVHFGDKFTPHIVRIATPRALPEYVEFDRKVNRHVLDINSPDELPKVGPEQRIKGGDQVKVRVHLSRAEVFTWAACRDRVKGWATQKLIDLCGCEMVLTDEVRPLAPMSERSARKSPESILREFTAAQDLPGPLIAMGLDLL